MIESGEKGDCRMSEAILLSVNPPYAGQIVSGRKRVEWRKAPLPTVKAYIYETKRGGGCGMVIGEVDIVGSAQFRRGDTIPPRCVVEGCVSIEELKKYTAHNPKLTGNLLQNAKRYDEPKPLSDFMCDSNQTYDYPPLTPLKRPPQSWCYVEELSNG